MKLYKAIYSKYVNDKTEESVFEFKAIDNDEARTIFKDKIEYETINKHTIELFLIGEQISI